MTLVLGGLRLSHHMCQRRLAVPISHFAVVDALRLPYPRNVIYEWLRARGSLAPPGLRIPDRMLTSLLAVLHAFHEGALCSPTCDQTGPLKSCEHVAILALQSSCHYSVLDGVVQPTHVRNLRLHRVLRQAFAVLHENRDTDVHCINVQALRPADNRDVTLPLPMLLSEDKRMPLGKPGWLYEIKFDGYRLVAGVNGGEVELRTRNGADATKWFPEVVQSLQTLKGGPHILDGEVCVLDDVGRSDFNRLQDRARRRKWFKGCDPVVFCAFDLLEENGKPLIGLPVEVRKERLAALLTPAPASVLYVGHFDAAHGQGLYDMATHLKLEGLVAKREGSFYVPGERSVDWLKCKVPGSVPPERFKR